MGNDMFAGRVLFEENYDYEGRDKQGRPFIKAFKAGMKPELLPDEFKAVMSSGKAKDITPKKNQTDKSE